VTVPNADAGQSRGDAPASRSTIAPIAAGTAYAAPGGTGAASRPTPGAPSRACVVRPSSQRVRAGNRTTLTVRVALRGKPLKAVRVVALAASMRRLAQGKTARDGRARLRFKPARRGTITVKVAGRRDCDTAALTVLRAKAKS
jgi:hypothetical protein